MPALGVDMSDREPVNGWEGIHPSLPHTRPENTLYALCIAAWKLASQMVDEGRSWEDIRMMQDTAIALENMARAEDECDCSLPEQSCPVCRAKARVVYEKEFNR